MGLKATVLEYFAFRAHVTQNRPVINRDRGCERCGLPWTGLGCVRCSLQTDGTSPRSSSAIGASRPQISGDYRRSSSNSIYFQIQMHLNFDYPQQIFAVGGCRGFRVESTAAPHSTTTGTAGTWQQSGAKQQPLLPCWKFNFVKAPALWKCDFITAERSATVCRRQPCLHRAGQVVHPVTIVSEESKRREVVTSTWTTAVIFSVKTNSATQSADCCSLLTPRLAERCLRSELHKETQYPKQHRH
jgi:hypothetical protein